MCLFGGWAEIANVGFEYPLHNILGRAPVDCGVMDLDHLPTELKREAAWACVDDAVKRKRAFKYATVEGEYKTRVQTVFAQAEGGAQWLLVHAYDRAKNRYPVTVKRCESIRVDRDRLRVAGTKCVADDPQLPPPKSSWPFCCYEGFVESIDALTGPGAIDCGFINQNEPVDDKRRLEAAECAGRQMSGRAPFKFGNLPPKSGYAYVVLRSAAGEIWLVIFRRTLGRDLVDAQFNQTCKWVMIDPATLHLDGLDCRWVSDSGLPTYDPTDGATEKK
jgi:hypothetical protein